MARSLFLDSSLPYGEPNPIAQIVGVEAATVAADEGGLFILIEEELGAAPLEICCQPSDRERGEGENPVFSSLALPNQDTRAGEVQVIHIQVD